MKLLKSIVGTGLTLSILCSTVFPVFATNDEQVDAIDYVICNEELTANTAIVNGQKMEIYKTFSSQDEAMRDINSAIPNFISQIADYGGIDVLNSENWHEFRSTFYEYVDNNNVLESSSEYMALVKFFDIYENQEKNEQIHEYLQSNSANLSSDRLDLELAYMMPFSSELAQVANANVLSTYSTFNKSKAIDYATAHATSPNKDDYYYFSNGDCANFASQILEYAGIQQIVYSDVSKGWWHITSTNILGIKTHKHSQSWTMADVFARYMGVSLTTTNHVTFASKLLQGDFIAADWENDGDWDHIGFVTSTASYVGTCGYQDYKVAQHTSNYLAWASSSTNNWDVQDGRKYAVVRRGA